MNEQIIFNNSKVIVHGNVYINTKPHIDESKVSIAKDKFVELIYNKRDKKSWASRKEWQDLLEDYLCGRYWDCYNKIVALNTTQVKSKEKALGYLQTIITATY